MPVGVGHCCTACALAGENHYEIDEHQQACAKRERPRRAVGKRKHKIEFVELKGGDVPESCMGFAQLVYGRKVLHPGDPLLDAHVAASSKLHSGDTWRFVRKGGAGHVDAAYAGAGAAQVARTFEFAKPRRKPMVV